MLDPKSIHKEGVGGAEVTTEIMVALISAAGGIIVGGISIYVSKSIILYRLGQLEAKVEKHNRMVERTYVLERDVKTAFKRIDEHTHDIERLEERNR